MIEFRDASEDHAGHRGIVAPRASIIPSLGLREGTGLGRFETEVAPVEEHAGMADTVGGECTVFQPRLAAGDSIIRWMSS